MRLRVDRITVILCFSLLLLDLEPSPCLPCYPCTTYFRLITIKLTKVPRTVVLIQYVCQWLLFRLIVLMFLFQGPDARAGGHAHPNERGQQSANPDLEDEVANSMPPSPPEDVVPDLVLPIPPEDVRDAGIGASTSTKRKRSSDPADAGKPTRANRVRPFLANRMYGSVEGAMLDHRPYGMWYFCFLLASALTSLLQRSLVRCP